jgi:hypothetical protein
VAPESTPAPPPHIRRVRRAPQPARYHQRLDPLGKPRRGLQPQRLTPGPSHGGQATAIWVSHNPAVLPPPAQVTTTHRGVLSARAAPVTSGPGAPDPAAIPGSRRARRPTRPRSLAVLAPTAASPTRSPARIRGSPSSAGSPPRAECSRNNQGPALLPLARSRGLLERDAWAYTSERRARPLEFFSQDVLE